MKVRIFNNATNQYEESEVRYLIIVNNRKRYFATLALANTFAGDYFKKHNVVLGITTVPPKKAVKTPA